MKRILATALACFLLVTGSSFSGFFALDKISAVMLSRQVQAGKSVTVKGEIYYRHDGNMVTRFTYPRPFIVIANKLGEVKIYDPSRNTVIQYQNFLFSTQSSQFYYFFSGKSADMGLSDIGFVQEKTYPEKNVLVSLWKLKVPDKKAQIQKVKLVYQGPRPVYMHYQDANEKVIRKVYYANYTQMENYSFPATTTEIIYNGQDSTVSKTSFFDFKFNQTASNQYFDFQIPSNAKIEK